MTIKTNPIQEGFAAHISAIDLSTPLNAEDVSTLEAAIHTYGVLVFPDQRITDAQ